MRTIDLNVDVAAAAGLPPPAHVAASLHLPDELPADGPVELLVCLHGGGYRRSYWHPTFVGPDYSFAVYMTARGHVVLTMDHLGMGASSRPQPERQLTRLAVAAANHHVTRTVVAGLQSGRYGIVVKQPLHVTGVGHSIGGMMLITQAAAHRSFERVAVLGWANQPLVLSGLDPVALAATTLAEGYHASPREAMRPLFYLPDVPRALIEADEADGSTTPSCLGRDALTPGIVHEAAAAIRCPVFVLYGEVDTTPDPHGEVPFFKGSADVTLVVLKGAAHCHNFAARRHEFFDRFNRWIDSIPVACAS